MKHCSLFFKNKLAFIFICCVFLSCKNSSKAPQINDIQLNNAKLKDLKIASKLEKIEYSEDHVSCYVKYISSNCDLAKDELVQLSVVAKLALDNSSGKYLQEVEGTHLIISEANCINGLLEETKVFSFPLSYFSQKEQKYSLETQFVDELNSLQLNSRTDVFKVDLSNIKEINTLNKNTEPYLSIANPQTFISKRYLNIVFNAKVNPEKAKKNIKFKDITAEFYVLLYDENGVCSDKVEATVFTSSPENKQLTLSVPFTSIYKPAGSQKLTYKIFVYAPSVKSQLMHTGAVSVNQPQLYWLSFQTQGADINVDGMDKAIGQTVFSKKAGLGKGDAFFRLENPQDILFTSAQAKHSGAIPNQKGFVQLYLDEPLKISFLDQDVIGAEWMADKTIEKLTEGAQKLTITNEGRVNKFEFNYTVSKVNSTNYSQKNKELNKQK